MFWQRQTAPARIPTDTVVGLKFLDDSLINRNFVMNPLYIFDDVLDAKKLRSSLERLVEREGFRKLGARLRKNVRQPGSQGTVFPPFLLSFSPPRPTRIL